MSNKKIELQLNNLARRSRNQSSRLVLESSDKYNFGNKHFGYMREWWNALLSPLKREDKGVCYSAYHTPPTPLDRGASSPKTSEVLKTSLVLGLDASYATSTNYVDNAKMKLFGDTFTTIPDYFTVLDPKNDSIDDDADGAIGTDTGSQAGDIDGPEIQVPGRININTAPSGVLAALPGTSTNISMNTWNTLIQAKTGYSLINNIISARPYSTIGALTSATGTSNSGMNYFGTDNVDNDGDGFIDEKDLIFTSIANLITTHSNVFAVYVTARIVNSSASQTFAEKKLVAIVDRSVNPIKIRYFRWMTEW